MRSKGAPRKEMRHLVGGETDEAVILGRNPALEVLRAGRREVRHLWVAEGAERRGTLARILGAAEERGVPVERVPRGALDLMGTGHQGVCARVGPYPYGQITDVFQRAGVLGEPLFVLLLDVLQNPQNVGTLMRTAEAVGVHGVVMPPRRGVGVTSGVVSASAGASEHLTVVRMNLAQAIRRLQEAHVWVLGLDTTPEAICLEEARVDGALALVVGSEGEGLRHLVRKSCDQLARIPMRGWVGSLNAAVAGSIALYIAWRARDRAAVRGRSGSRDEVLA